MSEQPSQEQPNPLKGKPLEIQPQDYGKLELSLEHERGEITPNEDINVLIKVQEPKYVPKSATPRAWMSDYLFSARIKYADLSTVLQDPNVVSVGFSKPVREK